MEWKSDVLGVGLLSRLSGCAGRFVNRAKLDPKFVAGDHLAKAATVNLDGNRATHLHRFPNVISLKERVAFVESNHLFQSGPAERFAGTSFYHGRRFINVSVGSGFIGKRSPLLANSIKAAKLFGC
jgi:hypothetical protein